MKRNQATLAVLLAALSLFAAPSVSALPQSQIQVIQRTVADVPAAELAAKAADIVVQANKSVKEEVAVVTVREVAAKRPSTIVAVVGAIAKAAPEVSVATAAEASKLVAEKAPEIARAAAAGDPAHASQIAAAVSQVAPKSAVKVARAVVTLVPDQTPRILDTVMTSVPSSRAEIKNDPTITRLSERMASQSGGQGVITTLPGTISGRPVPLVPPTDAGTPTAGRDYARP